MHYSNIVLFIITITIMTKQYSILESIARF